MPKTIKCFEPECTMSFESGGKWDNIRAVDNGWFLQKSGETWCPQHTPDWVEKWREDNVALNLRTKFLETIDAMLLSSDQTEFELMNSRKDWFLVHRSDKDATPVAYKIFIEMKKET